MGPLAILGGAAYAGKKLKNNRGSRILLIIVIVVIVFLLILITSILVYFDKYIYLVIPWIAGVGLIIGMVFLYENGKNSKNNTSSNNISIGVPPSSMFYGMNEFSGGNYPSYQPSKPYQSYQPSKPYQSYQPSKPYQSYQSYQSYQPSKPSKSYQPDKLDKLKKMDKYQELQHRANSQNQQVKTQSNPQTLAEVTPSELSVWERTGGKELLKELIED